MVFICFDVICFYFFCLCVYFLFLFIYVFILFYFYLWESTQCCRWTGGAALAGAAGDHAVLGPEARASMDLIADQFVPSAEGALGLDVCLSVSALGRGGGVD